MADTTPTLSTDPEGLKKLGVRMRSLFEQHEKDRKAAEERWLQNLRQFRGIYDPEVARMIPPGYSRAYPKLTRWKVIGTVARLMQMLFPQTEKNFGVRPSPIPDLPVEQLQEVLNNLVAAKAAATNVDPRDVVCEDSEIEKAVFEYAKGRAERMEKKIDDDLQEMEYITLARKVVFSAVLYNVGVLEGPFHKKVKARTWERDENRGGYVAKEIEKFKPMLEFLPVWNWYPDMTAKTLDKQDMEFKRHVFIRSDVEALSKRQDFLAGAIEMWLHEHRTGNYQEKYWEADIRSEPKSDRANVSDHSGRKYEVISGRGEISGHELRAAGVSVSEAELGRTFQADVWLIDNVVIKARLAPLDDARHFHVFVFEDDDLSLLGNGQCDTLRDSQLSICEATRAVLDNAGVVGPSVEVNTELLTPGQNTDIRKHKTWFREGTGNEAGVPAVRNLTIESHITELIALIKLFTEFSDKESGLPPPSLGDVSGGGSEALRTQQNASMFLGAAALPIRDTVRNYDTFTISVISSLVKWNQKYDPNPSRDGDYDVIARGSTSLIAKEVLAQSLDVFRTTISEDELPHINARALLEERAKARDIPIDRILEDEDVAKQKIAAAQQAQQQQLTDQREVLKAQVEETLAKAFKAAAEARKADSSISVDVFTALMEALTNGVEGSKAQAGDGGSQPAA